MSSTIQPLADLPVRPLDAALPKADLHVHAEADARLDRVLARREGHQPHDWRDSVTRLLAETPPGTPRLARMAMDRRGDPEVVDALDADPVNFVARVVDLLEEGAAEGAVLIEVRFGSGTVLRPDFMHLFREAERQARQQYPRLRAEAIISGLMPGRDERMGRVREACLEARREGLAGVDFIPIPYDQEADWRSIYRWAEPMAEAGLGITAHAGEFSPANLAAALQVPGLTRLGHAVYAAADSSLLEALARSGVTVECCLTCNVVLGATASYGDHPIRQFAAYGIPVTLNTDDPVRVCTTIGQEYAIAAALGFSQAELVGFTRSAVRASFTSPERRASLLNELLAWEEAN